METYKSLDLSRRRALCGLTAVLAGAASPAAAQISLDLGSLRDIGRTLRRMKITEADEAAMGQDLFGPLVGAMGGAYRNVDAQLAVEGLARRIFATSSRQAFDWEIIVVDNNQVNAWALPGGKIGLNKGLLRYVDSEDELAAVIAHEMGHAEHSHAAKEMRKKAFYSGLSTAAQAAAVAAVDSDARRGTAAGAKGVELPMMRLVTSGYSRDLEHEADAHIVDVFAQTGHNVSQGAKFYETLLDLIPEKRKGTTSLFAGHPETKKRLAALQEASGGGEAGATQASYEFDVLKHTFPTRKVYKRNSG